MLKINEKILGYIVLILVAGVTSVTGFYLAKKIEKAEKPPQIISEPSQYPDWDAIKGKNPDPKIKVINITSDCPLGGCVNDEPATVDFDGIHKRYKVIGKFSRAYLYIEALVDYQRPLTVWDDVYFQTNGLGGHLIPDSNTLPVPPSDIARYIYDLRSISYFPTIKDKENKINKQNNINLFVLLQNGINIDMVVSVSSNRPGRVLREISIYYECFEGSNCAIEEVK